MYLITFNTYQQETTELQWHGINAWNDAPFEGVSFSEVPFETQTGAIICAQTHEWSEKAGQHITTDIPWVADMDKKYSDAEQYSKHDRDSHEADNARILFLDYGFTAEQIKRISETGYIFDWEDDARTDVRYCINYDLLPRSEKQRRAIKWGAGVADIERSSQDHAVALFTSGFEPAEDREGVHIAIAQFAYAIAKRSADTFSVEQSFRDALVAANCTNIEETMMRIKMEIY